MTQWGLDTLFNPAKRHMDEEKRRLLSTREEMGDSSGGKRIDLESGKVTIRRAEADSAEDDDAAGDADDSAPADTEDTAGTSRPARQSAGNRASRGKKPAAPSAAPSAAAQRAAARRRRPST